MNTKTTLGIFQLLEISNKFDNFIKKEIKKDYPWFDEKMRKKLIEKLNDLVANKMLEINDNDKNN